MPPRTSSAFKRPVRTNNDVEGLHRRLNGRTHKGQLTFYLLLQLLHEEAKTVAVQVKTVKLSRHQKKRCTDLHGHISPNWNAFKEGRKDNIPAANDMFNRIPYTAHLE